MQQAIEQGDKMPAVIMGASDAPLFADDIPIGISPVPSSTDHREDDPALVWRNVCRVEHVHAVLPASAPVGICICALLASKAQCTAAGAGTHLHPGDQPGGAPDSAESVLEELRRRAAVAAHSGPTRSHRRAAVLPALLNEPAGCAVGG